MSKWTAPHCGVSHYETPAYVATIATYPPFTTASYRRRGEGEPIERACFFAQPFGDGCQGTTEQEYREWGLEDHISAARAWCERKVAR